MIRWVLGIAGGALALFYLTGGGRGAAIAEGRSWKLVPHVSDRNWAKIYPDATIRLAAARALVVVKVESKETGARVPVLARIDSQIGPKSFRAHFVDDARSGFLLPRPWGPDEGHAFDFDLQDIVFIKED